MKPFQRGRLRWPGFGVMHCLLFAMAGLTQAQPAQLHTHQALSQALASIEEKHASLVSLSALAQSRQGKAVWLAEISALAPEERSAHPAVLVVAGVAGNRLAGTEAALRIIEEAAAHQPAWLEQTTLYVIPRLNHDAAEAYFQEPRLETFGNTTPQDGDNDGAVDEDGLNDLNGDGLITWMRIEDPEGQWIAHPEEPRILIEADAVKGEEGRWLYRREARDEDGDEALGEDPLGGVDFNHNFPFQYPWFDEQAGIHQVSEPPTFALAQFVVDHPHIALAYVLSGNSNLLKTPEASEASGPRSEQTQVREEDLPYIQELGKQFRERLGIEKEIATPQIPGALADWLYFHRGILTLSAPLWSPQIALARSAAEEGEDEAESENEADGEEQTDANEQQAPEEDQLEESRGQDEVRYLRWLEERGMDAFVGWQAIEHPDFPGQRVEVGGWKPYVKVIPPQDELEPLAQAHADALAHFAEQLPRIAIESVEAEALGNGVYEITVTVTNRGYLPTLMAHGERTGHILPTRVVFSWPRDAFLSGEPENRIPPLAGSGGAHELAVTVVAEAGEEIEIEVISALAGQASQTLTLEKE